MLLLWAGFLAVVVALLALDLGVFHRKAHVIGVREAAKWSLFWIGVGLSFTVPIYFMYEQHWMGAVVGGEPSPLVGDGAQAALLYLTGYVLEKSLSIDNIFVIAVIFKSFKIKPEYQHRVLYWGILGAIVTRGAMIFGGIWLLTRFHWLFYPFGAYLVITGIRMLRGQDEESNPEERWMVRWARKVVPFASGDFGTHFVVRVDGRLAFTLSFFTLVVVELTDVVFALDSVPAVLAITTNPFIVMTSNVFAILGLRSLYFVLASMMDRFVYLSHAVAAILVLVGLKMILHAGGWAQIPTLISLAAILLLVLAGIVASVLTTRAET